MAKTDSNEIVYLTKIFRTDREKNSYLTRDCKYIAFQYDYGKMVKFYPVNNPKAIESMKQTFKIEKALTIKRDRILKEIFDSDTYGILN